MKWYWLLLIGFFIGAYLHNGVIRHFVNSLIVRLLRGFIWTLNKSDIYYKPPEQTPANPKNYNPAYFDSAYGKKGIKIKDGELEDWLEKNPEIRVERR